MHIVIDVLVLALVAVFVYIGIRKGLFLSLMGLLTIVIAIIGASLFSTVLTEPITNLVYPSLKGAVIERFEFDTIGQSLLFYADGEQADAADTADGQQSAVHEMLPASEAGPLSVLRRFGVSENEIRDLIASMSMSAISVADRAAWLLVSAVVRGIVFILGFVACLLLTKLLTKLFDLVLKLPVLHTINSVGGGIFGFVEGVLLVYLVLFLTPRIGISFIQTNLDKTFLLRWFANNSFGSLIALLIGA